MTVEKLAYFYFKLENEPCTEYAEGYEEWFLEYFKEDVRVLDNNGGEITAHPDSVYLVPPRTRMYFKYNKKTFIHTAMCFAADSEFMASLKIPYRTPIAIKHIAEFERLLFDMHSREHSSSQFCKTELNLYAQLIVIFIHNELYQSDIGKIRRGEELAGIRATMMNSLAFEWTVDEMAKRANLSKSCFERKYKEMYGKTPSRDLYDLRFEKAKSLIDNGYSIEYILHSCCFKSRQHFSRFFKERAGITPTQYKNRASRD